MLVCSLPTKSRKRLAHNVFDAFATQASLVHDISDKDCWAQNSSICGHVATFKQTFNKKKKLDKKKKNHPDCCMSVLFLFLEGRALDASLLQFSFKRKPMIMMILSCSILPCPL